MSDQRQLAAPRSEPKSFILKILRKIGGGGVPFIALLAMSAVAQTPPEPPPGKVISSAPTQTVIPPDVRPETPVTDDERAAVEITSLSLDLHLIPADAREETHATLTLKNGGAAALTRIPLQLSSTLHWLTISAPTPDGLKPVAFTQSPIATDADHTGYAEEAVLTLPTPLAPDSTLTLSVFYAGEIKQNADRLELIGAEPAHAIATDWDAIAPTSDESSTALRGFGDVLWYPVAAPAAHFGDGNRLFDLIAQDRRHNTSVAMRLRLTVEYAGDPPDAVIFNGRLEPLSKAADDANQLIDEAHGLATAEFAAAPIGFRTPSLFLTAQHAVTAPGQPLTIISPIPDVADPYAAAVESLSPVLAALFGATPRSPLLLLDHPGEPFEDAGFLAAQLSATADPKLVAPRLVRALTSAWFAEQSRPQPASGLWIDQGLPEFASLVWTERTQGREEAIDELRQASSFIALAESNPQPLTEASTDIFLRLKSAFVFWQLRELLGEELFSQSLAAWRHSLALNPAVDRDEKAFEKSIEKTSKRELAWFFDDWVYRDRGLPDLTIVSANPRPVAGRASYIVAVEVRNDGDCVADVPVTVRSGALSATERLRIAGHTSASTRIVFEGHPESVEVNDGSVPELRATTHTLNLTQPTSP
jgi:hypothetical protein